MLLHLRCITALSRDKVTGLVCKGSMWEREELGLTGGGLEESKAEWSHSWLRLSPPPAQLSSDILRRIIQRYVSCRTASY